jgi:hypothetical protein
MNATAIPFVSDRLVTSLEGLYRAVAARSFRGEMATAMILLVCGRIRRVEGRIQALLVRFRAGLLPVAPVTRVARAGVTRAGEPRETAEAPLRLPRSFGWLLPLVHWEAANFASQFRHTLAEPEMMALLAASPQARRLLAPLCRMLAIEKEVLMPAAAVLDAASAETEALAPEGARSEDCPEPECGGSSPGPASLAPDCPTVRDGSPAERPYWAGPPWIVSAWTGSPWTGPPLKGLPG